MNYSGLGDTWNESEGLTEKRTALKAFRTRPYPTILNLEIGNNPSLLSAGTYNGKIYFLECSTGFLFSYDVQADFLECKYRTFIGNGLQATGVLKRTTLKPFIFNNELYFTDSGNVYALNLDNGLIRIYYAGNGEILKFN